MRRSSNNRKLIGNSSFQREAHKIIKDVISSIRQFKLETATTCFYTNWKLMKRSSVLLFILIRWWSLAIPFTDRNHPLKSRLTLNYRGTSIKPPSLTCRIDFLSINKQILSGPLTIPAITCKGDNKQIKGGVQLENNKTNWFGHWLCMHLIVVAWSLWIRSWSLSLLLSSSLKSTT